jgi:hypothetical protein
VNEFILLGNADDDESLTIHQFHDLVDGALRT